MNLGLTWLNPLDLADAGMAYDLDLGKVPEEAGVYVFGRRHGKSFEALYVGKADILRRRVKTQLNNLRLMQHLKTARSGRRSLMLGVYNPKGGQRKTESLQVIERAMIRYFMSQGHDLVNLQGITLRHHQIDSVRSPTWFVPRTILIQR